MSIRNFYLKTLLSTVLLVSFSGETNASMSSTVGLLTRRHFDDSMSSVRAKLDQSLQANIEAESLDKIREEVLFKPIANPNRWFLGTNFRADTGAFGTGASDIIDLNKGRIWSAAYGDNRYVAFGYTYLQHGGSGRYYRPDKMYSSDGINWSIQKRSTVSSGDSTIPDGELTIDPMWVEAVEYYDGKFIALCDRGLIAYSSDRGDTWIHNTVPESLIAGGTDAEGSRAGVCFFSMAKGAGKYVAVGTNFNNSMRFNTSGAKTGPFTPSRAEDADRNPSAIVSWTGFGPAGLTGFKVVQLYPNALGVSVEENVNLTSVAYGSGMFLAIANLGQSFISRDGERWDLLPMPELGNPRPEDGCQKDRWAWRGLAYGNDRFIAIRSDGYSAVYLPSIGSWERGANIPLGDHRPKGTDYQWAHLVYGNGVFVATTTSGCNSIAMTEDGYTWRKKLITLTAADFPGDVRPTDDATASLGDFEEDLGKPLYANGRFIIMPNNYGFCTLYSDSRSLAGGMLALMDAAEKPATP